jgi:hypothetical protein
MAGQDEHVYGFNRQDAESALQGLGAGKPPANASPKSMSDGSYIVLIPSGGIAKRVTTTVTFVECDAYYLAGTGSTRTLTACGFKVWVGNMSTSADVEAGNYVLPTWHGGALLANWEDCESV